MSSDSSRSESRTNSQDGGAPGVYVTRALPGAALERLSERARVEVFAGPGVPGPETIARGARDADGLLCLLTDRVDAALLEACPRLRVISSCSVGVDHIDLVAATERGIPVGHTPGVLTETTADLAFALLLAASRRVAEADRFVRAGAWTTERRWEPDLLLGRDLHGATLGIVGLGATGRAVARRARGFGMHVVGWTRSGRAVPGVEPVPSLDALWPRAAFLSVHVALSPGTRNLVGAAELARLPRGPSWSTRPAGGSWTRPPSPRRCGAATSTGPVSTSSSGSPWRPTARSSHFQTSF